MYHHISTVQHKEKRKLNPKENLLSWISIAHKALKHMLLLETSHRVKLDHACLPRYDIILHNIWIGSTICNPNALDWSFFYLFYHRWNEQRKGSTQKQNDPIFYGQAKDQIYTFFFIYSIRYLCMENEMLVICRIALHCYHNVRGEMWDLHLLSQYEFQSEINN